MATSIYYSVSAPEALPRGVAGKLHGSGLTELSLEHLKVRFAALDVARTGGMAFPLKYKTEPTPIPTFEILIEFEPTELGYSFDPMRVRLRTSDDKVLRPHAYVGPGQLEWWGDTFERQRECALKKGFFKEAPTALPARTNDEYHALSAKRACFVLSFETTAAPASSIELMIDGIARGTQPVVIPSIRFSRRAAKAGWVEVRPAALP